MEYKFDNIINKYNKLYEADEQPEAAQAPAAEEQPTPDVTAPTSEPEGSEEFDLDAIMIQFTCLVQDALDFGRKYGQSNNVEIDDILRSRPYSKDEAVAKLDIIYQLMKSNIKPSTDTRGPGIN